MSLVPECLQSVEILKRRIADRPFFDALEALVYIYLVHGVSKCLQRDELGLREARLGTRKDFSHGKKARFSIKLCPTGFS